MPAANDNIPQGAAVRFPIEPRYVPPQKAARRLHITAAQFVDKAPALEALGFPLPCPVTGHYDLKAIDAWMDMRAGLAPRAAILAGDALNANDVVGARLAAMKRG